MKRSVFTIVIALCAAAPVMARPLNISIRGLGRPASQDLSDPAVARYRAFAAEFALAMAPKPMQPAETLGVSGFEFAIANSLTDISQKADYWQGQAGSPIFEGVLRDDKVPGALWTPTVQLRKGLPMSTEIGLQGVYLAQSDAFLLGGEFKMALHEQFIRYFPVLSLRAAFGRLMGVSDLDMLTGEVDAMASVAFGVGGMATLTPYAGYGMLFAHVNSQVIDQTPYDVLNDDDQRGGAQGSLYNFPTLEWQDNRFGRAFGGLRINVAMIEILYEANVGFVDFNKKTIVSHAFKLGFDV